MTSIIKVDQIQKTDGSAFKFTNVLEQTTGYCDGRTVNGTTFPTVTGIQDLSATYADVTGSNINYTPPTGATTVVYRFNFKWSSAGTSGISHWKVYLDSDEVTIARSTIASQYNSYSHGRFNQEIVVPFLIGGTDDVANAKLSSWTSAKTIKVQAREYDNSTYHVSVHDNEWWDGSGASGTTNQWITPSITITALGDT
jgi:hypothetical protein